MRDDGTFRFDHVRPDGYFIQIDGADITPVRKLIQVEERDVDIGLLQLAGTGRVVGTVHRLGGLEETVWPFAFVWASWNSRDSGPEVTRQFVTGEDGQFAIENAPEGRIDLQVLFSPVYDFVPSAGWSVQVIAGKTTEVRTFNRGRDSQLALLIAEGDGSRDNSISEMQTVPKTTCSALS